VPLPRWSELRRVAIERMSEHDVRWRSLGGLFVAGGALADLSLLLPVDEGSDTLAVLLVGIIAILSGLGMIALAERLPKQERWLSLSLAFGTVLITLAVIFNDAVASPYALIYVWVGFDAFFFLSRRSAYAHLAFVGACYAVALLVTAGQGQAEAGRWLLLMGTVGVIGTLADLLRTRSEGLIDQLGEAARCDPLTNLLNRRGFEERMEDELRRARRSREPVALVVGDLDHFKTINDRFGHHEGDDALCLFGDVARGVTREIDGIARIGGEEFAIVLPGADEHGGFLLAERLRRRVREALSDYGPGMSVSFGVSTFPRDGDDPDALLRAGDQALYLAKRMGRDRSVIYSPEVAASLRSVEPEAVKAAEQLPAVLILAETLDLRDTGTALHSQTVGRYAEAIAAALGLPPERVERVRLGGLLHDLGKIGVPDPILRKPGPLDDAEWAEMRKHPELGARILAGANLDDLSGWVLAHHERPDGRGYPAGLSGDEIPVEARILSVADSFEAMTSDRVYRRALPREVALEELRRHAGTQFDAAVVAAFLGCQAEISVPSQATSATTSTAASRPASNR
jgi:diguanylate cyclase (GGDEF)-like protein/putative nucleotidyltransferase with HDIG domain